MTIDLRAERAAPIERRRAVAAAEYPALWNQIISQWRQPGDDRAWLIYAANYLFRTGGVRWALDPLTLRQRLPQAPAVDLSPLSGLSFILLTHRHADHLDLDLIRALRHLPIRWVIPAPLLSLVLEQTGLPEAQVTIPCPLQPLQIEGITITPFEGLHWEPPAAAGLPPRGVPALGYLVEFAGRRWLFPGDVRHYALRLLPNFAPLDGAFAHLWLGRGAALLDEPPLLEAFCAFYAGLPVHRLIVTHLHEFGRGADNYWGDEHSAQAAARLRQLAPDRVVQPAVMGDTIEL
jgi:hypothetical protein